MNIAGLSAHFLDGGHGQILTVVRRPQGPTGISVLIVPPFAEEMNKTRKMLTDVSQALQARGIATILVDLYGTGDSEGEFRDATWGRWIEDLARAASWCAAEGWPTVGLLGVRLGCMLGAQLAREVLHGLQRTVFWQPVVDGDRLVAQFLRLRVAASMMDAGRESVGGLRQALRDGHCVEVAGYELSPRMAGELERLKLADLLGTHLGELHWMEVTRDATGSAGEAGAKHLEIARSRGLDASVQTFVGEPFWTSTEIVRIAELVGSTVEALSALTLGSDTRLGTQLTRSRQ